MSRRRDEPSMPLVYILAASHSGSTLLALLLGSHPDICTVGELKASSLGDVARYRCSCGVAIKACSFWNALAEDMRAGGFRFDLERPGTDYGAIQGGWARLLLRPLHRGAGLERLRDWLLNSAPGWGGHLDRTQQRNAALARAVLARTGKRVIVDSSKIGIRLKFLLRNPAFDVKVLRLVRDGRAVALTYTDPARYADAAQGPLQGGGMGGSRDAERLPLAAAAHEWRRSQEEALAIVSLLAPGRWTELRYEDLCADTAGVLRRLFAFLGVDPAARFGLREAEHHVIGNGMRLDAGHEVKLDERWREALGPAQLRVFDEIAGALNRRLGYS
jgi:hypothetical protein